MSNLFRFCSWSCLFTKVEPRVKKSNEFVAAFIRFTSAKYLSKNTLGVLPIIPLPTSSIKLK